MFPYKIQILQAQTATNKAERLVFCQSTSNRIEDHPDFLDLIFFSDEAHFRLSGHVNKQNMRVLAQAQPHEDCDLYSYLEHFQFPKIYSRGQNNDSGWSILCHGNLYEIVSVFGCVT